MSESLLQRLVGALVLGAVVLILWPVVMSPGRKDSFVVESDIPPRPQIPVVEIAKPLPNPPLERRPPATATPAIKAPQQAVSAPAPARVVPESRPAVVESKPKAATTATLDQNGLPVSWVVQVGSFGNPDNAARLKKALQAQGFKVHTVVQRSASRSLTRVIVGPYVDKSMAERDRSTIATKMDLAPKVLRFKS